MFVMQALRDPLMAQGAPEGAAWLNVTFACCLFVAVEVNDMCFPAMLICPVAEESCDLTVTFVNAQISKIFPRKKRRLRKENRSNQKHEVREDG